MADSSLYSATETPVLISNIQVLELLQKQQKQRQEHEAARTGGGGGDQSAAGGSSNDGTGRQAKKQRRMMRHRDWIEDKVMQYIQSTPCMKMEKATRQDRAKLQKKLTCAPPKKRVVGGDTAANGASSSGGGYGLMEAEALQILNFMPTEMVEIHLMIEELNERMTDGEQEGFLKFMSDSIASYQNNNKDDKKSAVAPASTAAAAAAVEAPTPPTTASANSMDAEMTDVSPAAPAATNSVHVKEEPT